MNNNNYNSKIANWLNKCEEVLTFMSIHSLVADGEKKKIRDRMNKLWEKERGR